MKKKRSIETAERRSPDERGCNWPGCQAAGGHRAPRSRDALNEYYWFCLEHVRFYNKNWNYYEGLDDAGVEADVRRDTTWERPTWPLGTGPAARMSAGFSDPFGAFDAMNGGDEETDGPKGAGGTGGAGASGASGGASGSTRFGADAPFPTPEDDAIQVLGIDGPLTPEAVKARYKILVKEHHPDANGGDKAAEERIKEINGAYQALMASMGSLGGR